MTIEPGFARLLAACFYDALAVVAVLFLVTVPWVALMPGQHVAAGNPWYQAWLVAAVNAYFSVGWMRGGQTLGMRAWRLYVTADRAGPLTWPRAIARFWMALVSWAVLGLGFAWFAFTGRSWHDLATGTRVEYRPAD